MGNVPLSHLYCPDVSCYSSNLPFVHLEKIELLGKGGAM